MSGVIKTLIPSLYVRYNYNTTKRIHFFTHILLVVLSLPSYQTDVSKTRLFDYLN